MIFFKVLCVVFFAFGLIQGNEHQHSHNKHHARHAKHLTKHAAAHQHRLHHHSLHHHQRLHFHHRISENGSIAIFNFNDIIVHVNGSVATALSAKQNFIGNINLQTRIMIVFNLTTQTYVRNSIGNIPSGTSVFNGTSTLFESLAADQGDPISEISDSTLEEYLLVLHLCGDPNNYTVDELPSHLENVEHLVEILNGTLEGFLEGAGVIEANRGVLFTTDLILALDLLLNNTSGGLQALISEGVKLNYEAIYHATSGFEILFIVLENVAQHANLFTAFGSVLNSPEQLIKFVVQFHGEHGVDLLFDVIYNVLQLVEGKGSINGLIQAVVSFTNSGDISTSISDFQRILQNIIQVIQNQIQTYNNSNQLQVFLQFFIGLQNNSFSFNNTNLSQIIDLFTGGSNPIEIIVQIASQINSFSTNIPQVFESILQFISNSTDGSTISSLLPGFNFSGIPIVGNIFESVFQNLNINRIFDGSGDVFSSISKIPIIGNIIRDIQVSLSVNGNNISQYLQPQDIAKAIQKVFTNSSRANTEFSSVIDNIINGIQNFVSAPVSIASSIQDGISGIISDGWNASQDLANSIQDGFAGLFNGTSFGVAINKQRQHHNHNEKKHAHHLKHHLKHSEKEAHHHHAP